MPAWDSVVMGNSILDAGVVLEMEFEAAGEIFPGDVVEFDTSDCPKIKAGQDNAIGIIGVADISMGSPTGRGAQKTVAYAAGDQVKVISGPIIVWLRLVTSGNITCGDHVQSAGSGEVKEYVCGTDEACQLLAQSLQTVAVVTQAFQWLRCRWLK